MTLRRGKLDGRTMERVVYRSLGSASSKVASGPGRGLDNAVLSTGGSGRMLVTTDPVSIIPRIGMRKSAWLSVHLIASDYTTSGRRPEFATFTYNMPKELTRSEVEEYIRAVGRECKSLRVAIVAGHTGSYPGGGFTVVGGGTMFGFCRKGDYIEPTMARPGDAIVMTKSAAIEAAAMLAMSFPRQVERMVGRRIRSRAELLLDECSTVRDALAASTVGLGREGVTSMHDATEGGILGGLGEMSWASGTAFVVEKDRVHTTDECLAICNAFDIDPLSTVSEGSLLLTCNPERVEELKRRLRRRGIGAFEFGRVKRGTGLWVSSAGGRARRARPSQDRYWSVYERSVRSGLA